MKDVGPIPEGLYQLGRYAYDQNGSFLPRGYLDQYGKGYFIDLNPVNHNAMGRTGLEIHPDGNILGTAGCIGIYCQIPELPQQFYKAIEKALNGMPSEKRPLLNVDYRGKN